MVFSKIAPIILQESDGDKSEQDLVVDVANETVRVNPLKVVFHYRKLFVCKFDRTHKRCVACLVCKQSFPQ